MTYHALFVIFEKGRNVKLCLLQIIGGALWVNLFLMTTVVLKYFGSPYCKQYGPRSDCSFKSDQGS